MSKVAQSFVWEDVSFTLLSLTFCDGLVHLLCVCRDGETGKEAAESRPESVLHLSNKQVREQDTVIFHPHHLRNNVIMECTSWFFPPLVCSSNKTDGQELRRRKKYAPAFIFLLLEIHLKWTNTYLLNPLDTTVCLSFTWHITTLALQLSHCLNTDPPS